MRYQVYSIPKILKIFVKKISVLSHIKTVFLDFETKKKSGWLDEFALKHL